VLEEAEVLAGCVVESVDRHRAPSIDRLAAAAEVGRQGALAQALLDGLPGAVQGLCDLWPSSALRASLLDRSALKLLQGGR
jgi:hypothetical protein